MPTIGSVAPNPVSHAHETPQMEADADQSIRNQLHSVVAQKHVLVFSGFSGAGYKDEEGVAALMTSVINAHAQRHGAHNVVVVAGSTDAGIGAIYKIARGLEVQTLGIVSRQAQPSEVSAYCQTSVYVDDPQGNWKVLSPEGTSYMVSVAQMGRSGEMVFIGGGAVAASELEESLALAIPTQIHSHYESKTNNGPAPLRQWCDKHPDLLDQIEGVVYLG